MGNQQEIDLEFLPRVDDNPFIKREILLHIFSFIPLVEYQQEEDVERKTFPILEMFFVCKYFRKHCIRHIFQRKVHTKSEIFDIFKAKPPEALLLVLLKEHDFFDPGKSLSYLFEESCSNGYEIFFQEIIKNPEFRYPINREVLKRTCEGGYIEIVKILISSKNPPLSILEPLSSRQSSFLVSCELGHVEILPILSQACPDIDPSSEKNKALIRSVKFGRVSVAKWLLGDENVIGNSTAIDSCMRIAFEERNKLLVKLFMKAPELYKKYLHAKGKLSKLTQKLEKEVRTFRSFSKIQDYYEQMKTTKRFFLNSIPGYYVLFPYTTSPSTPPKKDRIITSGNQQQLSHHSTPKQKKKESPNKKKSPISDPLLNSPSSSSQTTTTNMNANSTPNTPKSPFSDSVWKPLSTVRRNSTFRVLKTTMYQKEEASLYFLRFFPKLITQFKESLQIYESEFFELDLARTKNEITFYRGPLNSAVLPHGENGEIWVEKKGGVLRSVVKLRRIFSGRFQNGVKQGNGKEYWLENGKMKFRGVYKSGRRDGLGQTYEKDGRKVKRKGVWRNGKFYRFHMEDLELEVVDFNKLKKYLRRENRLGGGSYGDVYRVMYKEKEVACKVLNIPSMELRDLIISNTAKSLRINASLFHPNIVKVLGWSGGVQRVFEYNNPSSVSPSSSSKKKKKRRFTATINKEDHHNNEEDDGSSSTSASSTSDGSSSTTTKTNDQENQDQEVSSPPISSDYVGYIMELCENGSVAGLIGGDRNILPMKEKVRFLYQIACGMEYLHSNQIMHRDLKWSNVLLNGMNDVKITDFDFAKHDESSLRSTAYNNSVIGTPIYCAPEILQKKNYDQRCDVFSFGIMIYTLIANTLTPYKLELYSNNDNSSPKCSCGENLEKIFGSPSLLIHVSNCELRPNSLFLLQNKVIGEEWAWLIDLMKISWIQDPERRPTFSGIVNFIKTFMLNSANTLKLSINMISMKLSHQEDSEAEKYLLTDLSIKGLLDLIQKTFGTSKTIERIYIKRRTTKNTSISSSSRKKKEKNNNKIKIKEEEEELEEFYETKVTEDEHVKSISSKRDIIVIEFLEKEDHFDLNSRKPSVFMMNNKINRSATVINNNNNSQQQQQVLSYQKEITILHKYLEEKEEEIKNLKETIVQERENSAQMMDTYDTNQRRIEKQLEVSNVDKVKIMDLVRKMKEKYELQMERLREVEKENKFLRQQNLKQKKKNKAILSNNRRLLILLRTKLREEMDKSSAREMEMKSENVFNRDDLNREGMLGPAHFIPTIENKKRSRSVFVDPSHLRANKKNEKNKKEEENDKDDEILEEESNGFENF